MIANLHYQGPLDDCRAIQQGLERSGLTPDACGAKARLFAQAAAGLEATRGGRPTVRPGAFFVPGRIEVLGKHTDYAGGRTMVAATERGMAIVARARDDDRIQVTDAVRGETVVFRREPELVPPAGHWANYPITVARRLARNFASARRGAAISFASDLPPAAGMSSSSTLMVATFLALDHVQPFSGEPLFQREIANLTDLAGYLATVENGQTFGALEGDRGVGTFGGSEDHTAILCAQPGQISQYGYCPVRFERAVPLPPGHQLAIAVSGVVAEKTGAARERYNRASQRATEIVRLWRRATGADHQHLATVLASSADAAGRLSQIVAAVQDGDFTADELSARMEHFFIENEQLVPAAGDALACGDLAAFGRLVDRSQQASQQLLGNQVPQTVFLAAVARAEGAAAASAFGAGFGGSVWALVDTARAEDFLAAWSTAYGHQFPENAPAATFFLTAAGPAAFQLSG